MRFVKKSLNLAPMYSYLDKIDNPDDLKKVNQAELGRVCSELREYMLDCCSRNPGHVASSLCSVEIITGLHYIYDTPSDKIVFDVGHQAYAHKILTGRRDAFRTLRQKGGLSGFPKMDESPYDAFGVGHSSTSISAALGYAEAARIKGDGTKAVAVIGDGALTGGLAFEGMNNAGDSHSDILVILNDNNHSIDEARGAIHEHLLRLTTNPSYNKIKGKVWERMGDSNARNFVHRWSKGLKSYIVKKSGGDLFESLGFRYFGPIDGNDIQQVVDTLRAVKDLKGPRILHCVTTKGYGYAPAEADPTVWHSPGKFDPETGERVKSNKSADRYQDVFGEVLVDLAKDNEKIVGITPAMSSGCGMNSFSQQFPERFFDVGIEEEHAVTFSAGLAAGGLRPVCNIYSSFSQRAYDQIIHDVALQNLPVVFCFDRAGVVGEDGPTHHGAFDMAAYRSIPNMTIASPRDELSLKNMMGIAIRHDGPFIIRYPRGGGEGVEWKSAPYAEVPVGKGERLVEGSRVAILGIGPVCNRAVEAAEAFKAETGESPAVYDMRYIKPIDTDILAEVANNYDCVITLEDGCAAGGLFGAVAEYLASCGSAVRLRHASIPDKFVPQASRGDLLRDCGLDSESIFGMLQEEMKK